MAVYLRIALVLIVLLVLGSAALLVFVDLEPPTQPVQKIIPNDRFNQ